MELLALVTTLLAVMIGTPVGADVAIRKGMLLHPLRRILERSPKALHKPLFGCSRCMVSVWGIAPACLVAFTPWPFTLLTIPILALAAVGWMEILEKEY